MPDRHQSYPTGKTLSRHNSNILNQSQATDWKETPHNIGLAVLAFNGLSFIRRTWIPTIKNKMFTHKNWILTSKNKVSMFPMCNLDIYVINAGQTSISWLAQWGIRNGSTFLVNQGGDNILIKYSIANLKWIFWNGYNDLFWLIFIIPFLLVRIL